MNTNLYNFSVRNHSAEIEKLSFDLNQARTSDDDFIGTEIELIKDSNYKKYSISITSPLCVIYLKKFQPNVEENLNSGSASLGMFLTGTIVFLG